MILTKTFKSILFCSIIGVTSCALFKPGNAQNVHDEISIIENRLLPGIKIKGQADITYSILDRMEFYNVPGFSVAIVRDRKLQYAKTYGVADVEKKVPLDANTLFQAASISKPISALGVLKLVQNGMLDLDVDINTYLKSWKVEENEFTKTEKVTARMLLTHTAGIRDRGFNGYTQSEQIPTTTQVLNGEGNSEAVIVSDTPGAERRYSGGGYVILQQLIEDIVEKPFEEFMENEVLRPLGMTNSTYQQPLDSTVNRNVSLAYTRDGNMIEGGWHNYPEKAPGGLWTTPSDYAKYCIAIQNIFLEEQESFLSKKTIDMMLVKHKDDWGLGPIILGSDESLRITHDGSNKGFKADFTAFLNTGDAVIMFSNGDNGGSLGNEFIRSVSTHYDWGTHNQRTIDPPSMNSAELEKFVGTYAYSENRNYLVDVQIKDGKLNYIAPGRYGSTRLILTPFGRQDFIDLDTEIEVRFQSKDGEVQGLTWRGQAKFEKVQN